MNKSFLKILTFSLLSFIVLMGCAALEDKPVPDPKPYVTEKNTMLDMNILDTFTGNYKPSIIITDPLKSDIDIDYLNGVINIFPNKTSNQLEYNYAVYRQGYKDNGTLNMQSTLLPLGDVTIDTTLKEDRYNITLTTPITITDNNGNTYKISALRKISDSMTSFTNNTTEEDITTTYTVCDPLISGTVDPNSCTSVDGAMKYIGYYRIENITCAETTYYGGTDFAGEMVTNPSLASNLDVTIPITVKVQVQESSPLKQCLLTTDEQTNNTYFKTTNHKLTSGDYAGGLNKAFEKVGLIGLKDDNVTIRTTQIDYNPKDTGYNDLTFGDAGNKVTMRLKFIQNSTLNLLPVVQIQNTKYYQ